MKLLDSELKYHKYAANLPTDAERQTAFASLNERLRQRLKLPENRFFSRDATGNVTIDSKRTRTPSVKKISKSDLT